MKKLIALIAFTLLPLIARAQTPGAQPEFCVTSPSQTADYNQLCISASSSGGQIAVTNFGTATGGLTGTLSSLSIIAGTLAPGASAFSITATQPALPVASQKAVSWSFTSAGSASQGNSGFQLLYLPGYTGSFVTSGFGSFNEVAGTGATLIPNGGSLAFVGNTGITSQAIATTTGYNVGYFGGAVGGNINVGILGLAQGVKNSATNIGGAFSGVNTGSSPIQIGIWASLNQTTPPSVSAAAIFDISAQTAPIALFQAAGITVASVTATGAITATLPTSAGSGGIYVCVDTSGNFYKKSACP